MSGAFGARLIARARAAGDMAAARSRAELAAQWQADGRGITATETADGVRIEGRGLFARMLSDARLRWPGSFLT